MLPELCTPLPGPRSLELGKRLSHVESRNVTYLSADFPVFWQRAQGTNVWDVDGNRFVDFTSAFGVSGLGHNPPSIVRALQSQSHQLLHGMGDVHPTELKVELCELLSRITFERWSAGTGRTILGNAGFEAVEAALKTAHLFTGKPGVISFTNAYHGLGFGTLSAGSMPRFRRPFAAQLADLATTFDFPGCRRPQHTENGLCSTGPCDSPCGKELETLEVAIDAALTCPSEGKPAIGAILVEPIQGRGGKVTPPLEFLPMLRRLCDRHSIVLIVDEILTGLNRCGSLFACELSNTVPDIICLGKALSSSLPLSACIGREEVMLAWPRSDGEAIHTTTHLGNPMACAAAIASLGEHTHPDLAASVHESGQRLQNACLEIARGNNRIGAVRGAGLLRGLEIIHPDTATPDGQTAGGFVVHALKRGYFVLSDSPEGNILFLVPPFAISDEEISGLLACLQEYLTSLPGSVS